MVHNLRDLRAGAFHSVLCPLVHIEGVPGLEFRAYIPAHFVILVIHYNVWFYVDTVFRQV